MSHCWENLIGRWQQLFLIKKLIGCFNSTQNSIGAVFKHGKAQSYHLIAYVAFRLLCFWKHLDIVLIQISVKLCSVYENTSMNAYFSYMQDILALL